MLRRPVESTSGSGHSFKCQIPAIDQAIMKLMKSKTTHSFIISLILMVGYLTQVQAVTDAELEALEKQLEQQEAEEIKQAEAAEKKKVEAAAKRKAEIKRKSEAEAKRKAEEARLAELERKRQEEEAKKRAEKEKKEKYNLLIAEAEQAVRNKDKELAINKYNEALALVPGDTIANLGMKEAENLLEKGCYKIVAAWRGSGFGPLLAKYDSTIDFNINGTFKQKAIFSRKVYDFKGIWKCLNPDKGEFTKQYSSDETKFPIKIEGDKLYETFDVNRPKEKNIYQRVK